MVYWIALALNITLLINVLLILVSTLRAHKKLLAIEQETFFLPNNFFVSFILLLNYWAILFILLGAQDLVEQDWYILTMTLCFFVPFLTFWQKKRWEKHS